MAVWFTHRVGLAVNHDSFVENLSQMCVHFCIVLVADAALFAAPDCCLLSLCLFCCMNVV